MFNNPASLGLIAFAVMFFVVMMIGNLLSRRRQVDFEQTAERLRNLSEGDATRSGNNLSIVKWISMRLPQLGDWTTSSPQRRVQELTMSLLQAGYFKPNSVQVFLIVKATLTILLTIFFIAGAVTFSSGSTLALASWGFSGFCLGVGVPQLWLSERIRNRRSQIRNSMPDMLDMLVLCMDGGASIQAAIQRITDELQAMHSVLAVEMNIVQREMQLGLTAGEAIMKFSKRCSLSDIRDLANAILQSERFGASINKALRNFAESARLQRHLEAEERAQKAAVKILFPTLLCIFPAIFIVILGPAAYQTSRIFGK